MGDAFHLATALHYTVNEFHTLDGSGRHGRRTDLLKLNGNVAGARLIIVQPKYVPPPEPLKGPMSPVTGSQPGLFEEETSKGEGNAARTSEGGTGDGTKEEVITGEQLLPDTGQTADGGITTAPLSPTPPGDGELSVPGGGKARTSNAPPLLQLVRPAGLEPARPFSQRFVRLPNMCLDRHTNRRVCRFHHSRPLVSLS